MSVNARRPFGAAASWLSRFLGRDRVPAPAKAVAVPIPPATPPVERLPDPYRDRWVRFDSMLRDLDAHLGPNPPAPIRRLLFYTTMPVWTDVSLAITAVLAGRGCQVDFAWTPYPETVDTPISVAGREALAASGPAKDHPRLRVINLMRVAPAEATTRLTMAAWQQSEIDGRYVTRREETDFDPGTPEADAYDFRLRRNREAMTALAALIERGRYDAMVTPNGWVLEFGAAYRVAQLYGLPCSTLEVHDRRFHVHVGQTVPILSQTNDDAWHADAPHRYTPERERRVQHVLGGRASGDWAEYFWRCQTAPPVPPAEVLRQVGLDPDKPTALLCANVTNDSVVIGRTRGFASMADWVRQTIDLFAARPDWQLVVRAHPAEQIMAPNEPVEGIVRGHCGDTLPANVRLVRPGDPVNTYALMAAAGMGLVYNSTSGLEMAAYGVPVATAGQAHYGGKGFTRDAATPAEYATIVAELAAGPRRTPPRTVELARCYIDIYFHALPFAFPWSIGGADDYGDWPVGRVLSAEGEARFGRTFDYLAGLPVPMADRLQAAG